MIIVHIGSIKAGSTSIQRFFKTNEAYFRNSSIDYPCTGRLERQSHRNIAAELSRLPMPVFDPAYGTLEDLAEYWRGASYDIMVLSSEFFADAEIDQVWKFRETLSRARPSEEFRIVLIVRELVDLLPSWYAEDVKFGRKTQDFDGFFDTSISHRRMNPFVIAKCWAEVFSWQCVYVRPLDRKYLVNGDLVDDFTAICGIETRTGNLRRPKKANVSPGWKTLEAVRALFDGRYSLIPGGPALTNLEPKQKMLLGRRAMQTGKKFNWNGDKGNYMTSVQAQTCFDMYKSSVEAINRYIAQPLPIPLDPGSRHFVEREFLPDASSIAPEELRAFYDDLQSIRESDALENSRIW